MKIFIIYFVIVLAVVGLGYFLFQSSSKPPEERDLPGQTFENQGQDHIPEGSKEHVAYNSNPPNSGPHWPSPAAWGIYKATLPDEQLVHNLEHGGIWISYKSSIPDETKTLLEDFAKRYRKIIVVPRDSNDTNIALAAWLHTQTFESYDENAILRFIEAYYDQGPEKVP